MSEQPCNYILASRPKGTLYVGLTSDLVQRVNQLRTQPVAGFRRKHDVFNLVWYETQQSMLSAIEKDRALRQWNRLWVLKLVESCNPEWRDLYEELF